MTTNFQRYLAGMPAVDPAFPEGRPDAVVAPAEETWTQKNAHLTYPDRARLRVFEYVKPRLEKTDKYVTFSLDEVYTVQFSYTLDNWKALVSTTLPDGMYYEVTHDKDRGLTFIDAYKKFDNVELPD